MTSCLNCGSPLGSTDVLCYGCQSDSDVSLPPADEEVVEELREYCLIACVRCSQCGDIHGTVEGEDRIYTADDFDISSEAEWREKMNEREAWIAENPKAVQRGLIELEDEWPRTVAAIRETKL